MATARIVYEMIARDTSLSKALENVSRHADRLNRDLNRLDGKRVRTKVDVDVDTARRKLTAVERVFDGMSGRLGALVPKSKEQAALMAGAFGVALHFLPQAAAAAADGVTVALGGAVAAVGIAAAAQDKQVRKAFTGLKKHVVSTLEGIATPFEGTLLHVADVAKRTFDSFAPALRDAFAAMAPTLTRFADDVGKAFRRFKPAIKPITDAFDAVVNSLGPALPGIVDDITAAVTSFADIAKRHPETLAVVLRTVTLAVRGLAAALDAVVKANDAMESAFAHAAPKVLKIVRAMATGALGAFGEIVHGAAAAFAWVPGVGPKLKGAARSFDAFRASVGRSFDRAIAKAEEWGRAVDNAPKTLKLKGDIRDLEGKIAAAKARLKTVPPEKRSRILGEIHDLEAKVAAARRRLASLHDKTIHIRTVVNTGPGAAGVLRFRQHGGPVKAGHAYIVGERRAELFVPKVDGRIFPRVPATAPRTLSAEPQPAVTYNVTVNHVPTFTNAQDIMRGLRQAELAARFHRRR